MHNPYFDLIKAVWKSGKPWHNWIVTYYLAYIIAQAFLGLGPFTLGKAIDVLQHFTPDRLHEVVYWLLASIAVVIIFWIFHGPARVKEREVAMKIQQSYREHIYEKLTQLPLKWHQDHHSGNIITRLNRSATALYRFAGDQFLYIETVIKFIVSIGFLLWLSLPVGIFTLLSCSLSILIVLLYDRKLIKLYDQQNEIENHVGAVLFDYISNMTTILTLRFGDLTRTNLVQRMLAIWPAYNKDIVINEVKWFWMNMTLTTMQAAILIGYIVLALNQNGAILIGTVVMIFRYQQDLSEVFYTFSAHYSELVRMDTDVKGIQPILNDIDQYAHLPQGISAARHWHTIAIEQLSFHHAGSIERAKIFSDVNFSFKRGEKIALIGASGGGKSTLLNIIRGTYIPDNVKLMIDHTHFDNLEPLQAITTLIPQDPELFENTIEFNITMDVIADPEDVERAIKLACFDKVLENLPHGLQTDIREKGLNLSVGQKQRLALARGLFAARYSSLILMDEPTSSVDLPTEKEILSGVIDAYSESAMIVSLHRLHLLPKFDRIIMLDHGKVIADGATTELLNQRGPVRDLWMTYQNHNENNEE
ncbi:MAG TPA: ABC transporter ATP-binding protein [Gammaproteobacteria bacterium]|nr:ABC transporter ATP-binding protein [Gammaproteobacteria bacterium]